MRALLVATACIVGFGVLAIWQVRRAIDASMETAGLYRSIMD